MEGFDLLMVDGGSSGEVLSLTGEVLSFTGEVLSLTGEVLSLTGWESCFAPHSWSAVLHQ